MVFPEAAKYVIMNITFLSAPGAAVVMCMIMNEGKKKERNKKTYQYIWQHTANLRQKQLGIILLLRGHLTANGLQDFSMSYSHLM